MPAPRPPRSWPTSSPNAMTSHASPPRSPPINKQPASRPSPTPSNPPDEHWKASIKPSATPPSTPSNFNMPNPTTPNPTASTGPIVARASNEYRLKRLVIVIMLVGSGLWFAYDGFIGWPRENQRIADLKKEQD